MDNPFLFLSTIAIPLLLLLLLLLLACKKVAIGWMSVGCHVVFKEADVALGARCSVTIAGRT